jgi:hypothetical protein
MRTASLLLLGYVLAAGGCARGTSGEQVAPPPRPAAEDKPDAEWEVFKIELASSDGSREQALADVTARVKGDVVSVSRSGVFDHGYHTWVLGIDCRYCHKATEPASAATAAPTTCWNCHQNLAVTGRGVKVTPDNFAKVAAAERRTQKYLVKTDAKEPSHLDFVECDNEGRTHEKSPLYRAIVKDEGKTRLVALATRDRDPRPTEFKPLAPKTGRGEVALLYLRKK